MTREGSAGKDDKEGYVSRELKRFKTPSAKRRRGTCTGR